MDDGSDLAGSATPPGWYYAAGDPVGTHRYWDGRGWQGTPQPIGAPLAGFPPSGAAPLAGTTPASEDAWPRWLGPIVWIVTIAKMLPLVGSLLLGIAAMAFAVQVDGGTGRDAELGDFGPFLEALAGVLLVVVLFVVGIGSFLALGQLLMYRTRKPTGLLVWSILLSLLDVGLVLVQLDDFPFLTLLVAAAQIAIVVGAYQAKSALDRATPQYGTSPR